MKVRELLKKFPALDSKDGRLDQKVFCIMSHEGWNWQIDAVSYDVKQSCYVAKISLEARGS